MSKTLRSKGFGKYSFVFAGAFVAATAFFCGRWAEQRVQMTMKATETTRRPASGDLTTEELIYAGSLQVYKVKDSKTNTVCYVTYANTSNGVSSAIHCK